MHTPGAAASAPPASTESAIPVVGPRRRVGRLILVLGWASVLGALLTGLMALTWPDDLGDAGPRRTALNHAAFMSATFGYHAALAMGAVAMFALLVRRWGLLAGAIGSLALCGGPEAWLALTRSGSRATAVETVTVMSANVLGGHVDADRFMAEVAEHRPDVIVLQEWTSRAKQRLGARLENEYPHRHEALREHAPGQAVYSRRPFTAPPRTDSESTIAEPQITVSIAHDGRELRLANVHVPPPVSARYRREQRRMTELLAAAAVSAEADRPHVLAGDFNAVARSANMARLRGAGLTDSHREAGGIGRGSTWPRKGWMRWMPGIRLDHIVHEKALVCVSADVCADVGSDHAPVVATLAWNDSPPSVDPPVATKQAGVAAPSGGLPHPGTAR